jgi:exodeoxyribonuclease VII small subunit
MSKKKKDTNDTFSYPEAMQEIQQLLNQLESGECSFEESITLFKKGSLLLNQCHEYLDGMELEVKQWVADKSGTLQEEDFQ